MSLDDRVREKWWIVDRLVRVHRKRFGWLGLDELESLAAWVVWDREANDTMGATWEGCQKLCRWRLIDRARLARPPRLVDLPELLTEEDGRRRLDARRPLARSPPPGQTRGVVFPCVGCGDPAGPILKGRSKPTRTHGRCSRCAWKQYVANRRPPDAPRDP